jgi:hypothetical protein
MAGSKLRKTPLEETTLMRSKAPSRLKLQFHALTPSRWRDLERLFGVRGACGGCWCMWWRMKRAEFTQRKGEKNKEAFKKIVASGEVPGIIAYVGDEPVGWCALAPRERYPLLENSRVLARVDAEPVWSITCFFCSQIISWQESHGTISQGRGCLCSPTGSSDC